MTCLQIARDESGFTHHQERVKPHAPEDAGTPLAYSGNRSGKFVCLWKDYQTEEIDCAKAPRGNLTIQNLGLIIKARILNGCRAKGRRFQGDQILRRVTR